MKIDVYATGIELGLEVEVSAAEIHADYLPGGKFEVFHENAAIVCAKEKFREELTAVLDAAGLRYRDKLVEYHAYALREKE